MAELGDEKGKEKVPIPIRKREQKLTQKVLESGKQWETPRRWRTY